MSKFAELPDGTQLEFPDDTDDGVIDNVVKKHLGVSQTPASLVDQIPGMAPVGAAPEPEKELSWRHLVAPLEAGASVLSGLTTGALGGAVGGMQGILNTALNGTFGTQEGLKQSEAKMAEYANSLTIEPRTEEGKKLAEKANKALIELAGPLASVMPHLEAAATARGLHKNFQKGKAAAEQRVALDKAFEKAKAAQQPNGQQAFDFTYTPQEAFPDPAIMEARRQQALAERANIYADEARATGQGDLLEGTTPYTKEEMLQREVAQNQLPFDGPGFVEALTPRVTPQEALATNHTNPTIDFPLRQEVLENPAIAKAIEDFRRADAELSQIVDNAISPRVKEKAEAQREALRQEFGAGMEQLGIQNAADAYGRALYEARGEATTGAVQHTFDARKQRGAINPEVFAEGFENVSKFISGPFKGLTGQRLIASKQQGALKAFVKERNFDAFAKQIRQDYPDASPEMIKLMWEDVGDKVKVDAQTTKINKGLMPQIGEKIPVENITADDAIAALKNSDDSTGTNQWYRKSLMPGGYMPMEFADNPGLKAGFKFLKSTIDKNARKAEVALFETKTGIINALTKLETLFGPGSASDLIKQMFQAKDDATFRFNLDGKQQAVLDLINKQYDGMLQDINKYLPENKQLEALPNYIPSIHDGKWYVEINPAGSEGRPVLYGSHNKYALALKVKQLQLQGHTVSAIKERGNLTNPRWKTNEFGDVNEVKAANYQYMIDLLTAEDPAVRKLGQELSRDVEQRAKNQAGVNQRMKEFTGFQGNLGNNPFKSDRQNYFDAKKAMINSVEAHYSWVAAQEAAQFHRAMVEGDVPPNNRAILSDYIQGNVMGNSPKNVVDSLVTGVAESLLGSSEKQTTKALGRVGNVTVASLTAFGSPVHALQNVVQPLTVIMPHIVKEGGGMRDFAAAVTKIPAEYLYVFGGKQVGEIAKLLGADAVNIIGTENFNRKMQYALDTGVIDPTIVEASPMFGNKAANRVTDFAMQGVLSRPSEQAGRWAVFSAIYDLGIRKGLSSEKAATRAREITETYMVDYGADAKPRFFSEGGILGNTMGRLQTFASNQIAQTLLYLKNSKNSPKDAVAAMTYFATLATLGGIAGLPFFDLVEKIVNSLKSKDGETFSLRNKLRTSVGDVAVGGAWDTVGIGAAPSFASRTIGDNNLPSMLGLPTLGAAAKAGKTALRRLNPNTSWETETNAEKGKELLSITPVAARGVIEDKYLTPEVGGTKMNISGETGRVLHKQQPGEFSLGNIRSSERSKDADLNNQKYMEQKSKREQFKEVQRDVEERFTDLTTFGNFTEAKSKKLGEQINKYLLMGGTPEELQQLLQQAVIDSNVGDAELTRIANLANQNPNLKVLSQLLKEIEYQNLRKPQKGIFNFGVGKQ